MRGFPLKSATCNDLQKEMLSGISGISAEEKIVQSQVAISIQAIAGQRQAKLILAMNRSKFNRKWKLALFSGTRFHCTAVICLIACL